ncbi:uncharacterized protein [Branchiostoma lanceolatum]|uniref:uncharacterized protein n=1 Tax=Branchiostoma lanceolatum TaxID=7740 RepID=UPI003456B327
MPDDDAIPQQRNSNDCGVYACQFAYLVSNGLPLNLPQACVPKLRKWMVLELAAESMRTDRIKICSSGDPARGRQREVISHRERHRSPAPLPENRYHQHHATHHSTVDEGYETKSSSSDLLLDDSVSSARSLHNVCRPLLTSTPKKTTETDKKEIGKNKTKICSQKSISDAFFTDCHCGRDCCERLGQVNIYDCRKQFWDQSRDQQREYIRKAMDHADRRHESGTRSKDYDFSIKGFAVCWKAWCLAYGVSKSRYYRELEAHRNSWVFTPDQRVGMTYPSRRYLTAKVWLETMAAKIGDKMPDSTTVHLPHCLTMEDVFNLYKEDHEARVPAPLGRSQFFKMWRKELPDIKIPKPSDNFAKCTTCQQLKANIQKARSKNRAEELKLARKEHLLKQKNERAKYYKHIRKAQDQPQKYISIILDGMDQKKTAIPHYAEKTKDDGQHQLGTHVTGAIAHSLNKAYAAIDLQNISHDANLTVTVLMKILQDVATANGGHLPPVHVLYLQLDNCYRENKNCYVLAFCCELVPQKIVRKVKLSFLVVGHTHEDVDQFFSRISTTLKRSEATTLPELIETIEKSYTPAPEAFQLKHVGDYKEWLSDELENIYGHSVPHCFKFIMEPGANQPTILYKDYSTDRSWKTTVGTTETLLLATPTKALQFVNPSPIKRLEEVKSSIQRAKEVARLTSDQHQWWLDLFTSLEEEYISPPEESKPLAELGEFVIPDEVDLEDDDEEAEARREALAKLLARENKESEVRLSRKRRGTPTSTTQKRQKRQKTS